MDSRAVEPAHRVHAAQQPFVEDLRGTVERVIGIRVRQFGRRELIGEPVDRGRRCRDDAPYARVGGGLDHVVGAVDEHFEREPRLFSALRDPDRCLVEQHVDAVHQLTHEREIPDVTLDERHGTVLLRPGEVLAAPADEVVQDDDLLRAGEDEFVDDVRADGTAAACHEDLAELAHEVLVLVAGCGAWVIVCGTPGRRWSCTERARGPGSCAARSPATALQV